jgi:hypothetical protein
MNPEKSMSKERGVCGQRRGQRNAVDNDSREDIFGSWWRRRLSTWTTAETGRENDE